MGNVRRRIRKTIKVIAIVVISAVVIPPAIAATVLAAFLYLPLPAALPDPKEPPASQLSRVYDIHGNEIGVFRTFEQNKPFEKEDIPQVLKDAIIAAEDKNFYDHNGVDIEGSLRALYADVRNKTIAQGGSTITQQYVKNAYVGDERSLSRKVREAILAAQLDRELDKDEILYRYLSTIFLGDGIYGVGAAAESYFRKPLNQLTVSESATLAGLIPAPSRYAPRHNLAAAESKRKIVLRRMKEEGLLTQAAHDEALAQPLWLEQQGPPPGPVTMIYPPVQPDQSAQPYFVDYVRRYLTDKYGEEKVFRGGLQIQTTLDPRLQAEAQAAVDAGLKGTSPPLEMALVAVEPPTGYVKALVGGRDFAGAQVNLALGGCPAERGDIEINVRALCWEKAPDDLPAVEGGGTGRQPGSAFKPIVLAAAYEKGIQPSKRYSGAPFRIPNCKGGDECVIENFGGSSYGTLDLKAATKNSVNGVYARLIRDVGFPETADMAKKLGLSTAWYSDDFHTNSGTYSLGVIETSPLDMASAFGVFAARGNRYAPTPIVKVIDADGNILEDNTQREPERVMSEAVADNVTDALEGVVQGGTASRRGQIGRPAAGKTGTTTSSADAWFVGYTPTLSTAVWIGYSNSRKAVRLPSYGLVEGGEVPTATWARFMKAALKDVPVTEFSEPAPIEKPKVIEQVTEAPVKREIEEGDSRKPEGTPEGGPYDTSGGSSRVAPPPAPATSSTSTTSTTRLLPTIPRRIRDG